MRRIVSIDLGARSYPVVIDADGYAGLQQHLLEVCPAADRGAVLVTDHHVGPLWEAAVRAALPRIPLHTIVVPAGELHKTVEVWRGLVDRILAQSPTRSTPILALGGGMVGDLAGFAAACTLRGLPVVQLPTSLLAMVDASVGGKTAVNHPRGKNLIGAFHQPRLTWASLPTLGTLPTDELRSGLGEVIKAAAIGAPDLLDELGSDPLPLPWIVQRCVEVKAGVVALDELESGVRGILNAGHTVGHALETALGHGVLPHGHAVAIGLLAEARYAVRAGVCAQPGLPRRLREAIEGVGLPAELPEVDPALMSAAIRVDKKGSADTLCVPLPVQVGVYRLVDVPWNGIDRLWKTSPP
ncbi:MAG TPA: 3-dehydroquinate synthase [Deltaproteobacteria bacterium]|nr:3-dehydroquinate synthase [Deltaproteobacteria bacterium]